MGSRNAVGILLEQGTLSDWLIAWNDPLYPGVLSCTYICIYIELYSIDSYIDG